MCAEERREFCWGREGRFYRMGVGWGQINGDRLPSAILWIRGGCGIVGNEHWKVSLH
jgi:hypothetical protein